MKTLTKRKSLMGFIYALVMLLPFSSILVRCLYVTINKNAYLSYSQYTEEKLEQIPNGTSLNVGSVYTFQYARYGTQSNNTYYVSNNNTDLYKYGINTSVNIDHFVLGHTSGHTRLIVFDTNNVQVLSRDYWENVNGTFYFQNSQLIDTNTAWSTYDYNVLVRVGTLGTLDNAFDYSLYTFLNENGTGRLNLTDWFTDVFLNRTTHNMLYLNYVNWYMNYSLLVSCVYLLYSVLMWFLTFARYIINKPLKEEE